MTLVAPTIITIPAFTEREAMDWSLVLTSQGIGVEIDREPEGSWVLRVDAGDEVRAREAIRLFQRENRGFDRKWELPGSDLLFDSSALLWGLAVCVAYTIQDVLIHGPFDTRAFRGGDWWRAFSAEWMHRDPAHLASNLSIGIVFVGLAMARYGLGLALLGSYCAGALANVTGFALRPEAYVGLGASGMIMGALGMISAQMLPLWRSGRTGNRLALTALGTGACVFILTGTDPNSDVLAHLGGFVFGLAFGILGTHLPAKHRNLTGRIAFALFLLLNATVLVLASR